MHHCVKEYLFKRKAALERAEIVRLAAELRAINARLAPLRPEAEARRRAGVNGDGFVMKPIYNGG